MKNWKWKIFFCKQTNTTKKTMGSFICEWTVLYDRHKSLMVGRYIVWASGKFYLEARYYEPTTDRREQEEGLIFNWNTRWLYFHTAAIHIQYPHHHLSVCTFTYTVYVYYTKYPTVVLDILHFARKQINHVNMAESIWMRNALKTHLSRSRASRIRLRQNMVFMLLNIKSIFSSPFNWLRARVFVCTPSCSYLDR